MRYLQSSSIVVVAFVSLVVASAVSKDLPVIGILSVPNDETNPALGSNIWTSYASWVMSAGARAVPIQYDLSTTSLDALLTKLDGVLFTGGSDSLLPETKLYQTAKRIWDTAIEMNAAGQVFPCFFTCQGMQLASVLAADGNQSVLIRQGFNSFGYSMNLELTPAALSSRLLGIGAPLDVVMNLATKNITANTHFNGVEPSAFAENPALAARFKVLSTNVDKAGRRFVSTMEGRNGLPFYALQWHPEMAVYGYAELMGADHSEAAVGAAHWTATRFVRDARRSAHTFGTDAEITSALMENFPVNVNPYYNMFLLPPVA